MSFKILRKNCCGLDIHKTRIFACIGITDSNSRTEYKQAPVDGAISPEQAVKLRQCLNHIDELENHRKEIEREIFRLMGGMLSSQRPKQSKNQIQETS